MLVLMTDVPAQVVGVRALGKVDKAEYERVLLPEFERVVRQFGEINFLFVLETNVSNITLGAWMDDIKAGLKHFAKWRRIAIVTDQTAIKRITGFVGAFIPGEAHGYPISEIELAKSWVSAPKTAVNK